MRLRSLAIIVILLACLSSQVWSASPEYVVTDVGTLGRDGWAESINNRGQVVGGSYANVPGLNTASYFLRAFRWDRLGGLTDLGTLGSYTATAYGINDAGQVAGYSANAQGGGGHGFIWQDGLISDIGCPPTWKSVVPTAIDNQGRIVGYAIAFDYRYHAFVWQNGVMTELTPPAGYQDASANDINDLGQVVGWTSAPGTPYRPVVWENGQPSDLGVLPDHTGGVAYHINNRGQVTGMSYGSPGHGVQHCCLWDGGTVEDLNAPGGTVLQRFCAINDRGAIVGPPPNPGGPYVRRDGNWVDLNGLIAEDSGWQITSARDINNRGQIAGSGVYNGEERACLLTPYIRVAVDIRPGTRINPINPLAHGLVPVAILGAADFDPREVDPASVLLAGAPVAKRPFGRARYMARMVDVNHDSIKDLLLFISNEELNLQPGDTKAVLTGETYDGSPITGEDSVMVIAPRGKR